MLGQPTATRRSTSEGERPFWISYADLMTAMMMLFLAVMAVTIIAVTQKEVVKISEAEERRDGIRQLCEDLQQRLPAGSPVRIDCGNNTISIPDQSVGSFPNREYKLPQASHPVLADLVPAILDAAATPLGQMWLKRVVVEGYASRKGAYLYNLNLSAQRSYWVMCLLADPQKNRSLQLDAAQLKKVRQLFRVGGASFNKPKDTEEESRRVEFKLEFHANPGGAGEEQESLDLGELSGDDPCALT
jgi:outer membrane protein OmpA-like peptidoglycan-associated protein